MSNIILWDRKGDEIDLTQYGLYGLKLSIPAPSFSVEREMIEGRPGSILLDKSLDPRVLNAEFKVSSKDYVESLFTRDELYRLFSGQFYIAESQQPWKRWFVDCLESWSPDRINGRTLTITLPLYCEKGLAESINLAEYRHTSNFSLNNIGTETIDMRTQTETEIEFRGKSINPVIRNKTTGDEWSYTGTTTKSDVILLKGVRSTKNGQSIFKNTNKKILTFAPGWNDIEVIGSTDYSVTIRTRFYYL